MMSMRNVMLASGANYRWLPIVGCNSISLSSSGPTSGGKCLVGVRASSNSRRNSWSVRTLSDQIFTAGLPYSWYRRCWSIGRFFATLTSNGAACTTDTNALMEYVSCVIVSSSAWTVKPVLKVFISIYDDIVVCRLSGIAFSGFGTETWGGSFPG